MHIKDQLFSPTLKNLFVTGIDTNAGKTYASAYILRHHANARIAYYKPVQTGFPLDTDSIASISGLSPQHIYNTYTLTLPATPEIAFEHSDMQFDMARIYSDYMSLCQSYDAVIVEGAGGLYVPIADGYLMSDIILGLQSLDPTLSTVMVAANRLGAINHTGLSLSYAQKCNINLEGWVFSGIADGISEVIQNNASLIQKYTNVPYLGYIPHISLK